MSRFAHVWRNARWVLPFAVVNSSIYYWLNQHPLRAPRELPLTAIDRAVPFVPLTLWPYLILMLPDLVLPLALRAREIFRDTLIAYVIAIASNMTIWSLWPTVYPRPAAPSGDDLTSVCFRIMVEVDSPANCFPSGHITIPAVACWGLAREHPKHRGLIWATLLLFSVTVLTTKQHYFVDILGGFGTAFWGIFWSKQIARRLRPGEVA